MKYIYRLGISYSLNSIIFGYTVSGIICALAPEPVVSKLFAAGFGLGAATATYYYNACSNVGIRIDLVYFPFLCYSISCQ